MSLHIFFIRVVLRGQVDTTEVEVVGARGVGVGGGRGPEVAIAGDRVDGAGTETEVAGEQEGKWSLTKGLRCSVDVSAVLGVFIG